jgi:hypothetical protein
VRLFHFQFASLASTSNFHLSPPASAGAYVVFAVSPISLTIVTVGVYTLSVITLVFFVYSVANRSNFGRCSRPSDAFAFLITRCVPYSVGVLVFLVLGPLPPAYPPVNRLLTHASGIVLYSTVRDSFSDPGAMKVKDVACSR